MFYDIFFIGCGKKIGLAIKHRRNWNQNTQFNDNVHEGQDQLLFQSTGSQSLNFTDHILNPDKYDEVHRRVVQSRSHSSVENEI